MSKVMEYHLEELPQVLDATSPKFSENLRQGAISSVSD